jgi:hypothetical protein
VSQAGGGGQQAAVATHTGRRPAKQRLRMPLFQWAFLVAGVVLQSMVISAMLKGSYRRYPFVFGYLVLNLLSTVVQFSLRYYFGQSSAKYVAFYWISDFAATVLVLLIIIHLIRMAMEKHPYRNKVYVGLLLGVVLTAGVSVFFMESRSWDLLYRNLMTEVGRDYYFGAVILCAALWSVLVRSNHVNKQVYLITSGLGLQLTGAAIAHALRAAGEVVFLANVFLITTYLLNLYIWYVALKAPAEALAGAEEPEEVPTHEVEPTSVRR